MDVELRYAIHKEPQHSYEIVELCTRISPDSQWSRPYEEHMLTIRSNNAECKRIARFLKNLALYGPGRFRHPDDFRWVGDGKRLLELKPGSQRLLLLPDGTRWIIVHAFKKPPKKKQDQEIDTGMRRRSEYLEWKVARGP